MATKKKTNYIGYELEWLEERCQELREWVEAKLRGGIKDRIEVFTQGRTPIIKVISSEETQIKTLRDTLKELPSMLMEINRLRKLAEEEADGPQVRGDHDIPGFMEDDEDEDDDLPPPPKTKSKKQEKEDLEKTSPKKLLLPSKKEDLGFADDEDDTDDFDFDDGDFEDP